MRRRSDIALLLLTMFACCLISASAAFAQVRVFVRPEKNRDLTTGMRLRDMQAGKVDPRLAPSPCPEDAGPSPEQSTPRRGSRIASDDVHVRPRLTGGGPVHSCTFKDVVVIFYYNKEGKRARCSGVWVSSDAVLTAGHCACGGPSTYRILNAASMKDTKGKEEKIEKRRDRADIYYLVDRPSLFNGYRCDLPPSRQAGSDLAVLRVSSGAELRLIDDPGRTAGILSPDNATFGVKVATPGLIMRDEAETRRLLGAGFGYMEGGVLPEVARFGAIQIASLFCGQQKFAGAPCSGGREFVLADQIGPGAGGTDTCGGDSGGPVFYAPDDNSIALVGITSRALSSTSDRPDLCGGGGIYTAVGNAAVVDWLRSNRVNVLLSLDDKEN